MPLYDYSCKDCSESFSDMYKIDDRNIPCEKPCPNCGEMGVYISLNAVPHTDIMNTTLGTGKHRPTDEFREVTRRIKKTYPGARKTLKDY